MNRRFFGTMNNRLKTAVRRRIDQAMKTRNFRASNETVERGTVTKCHQGKTASAERRVGECDHCKTQGPVLQKGDQPGRAINLTQTQLRFRGRQIAYMIYEHFRVTGAREAVLDLADLFTVFLQGDDMMGSS